MKIVEKFKNFISKMFPKEEYMLNHTIPYTFLQFGDLKRYINENCKADIAVVNMFGEVFEIYYVYKSTDKYGDPATSFEQCGLYVGSTQKLHYSDRLLEFVNI